MNFNLHSSRWTFFNKNYIEDVSEHFHIDLFRSAKFYLLFFEMNLPVISCLSDPIKIKLIPKAYFCNSLVVTREDITNHEQQIFLS